MFKKLIDYYYNISVRVKINLILLFFILTFSILSASSYYFFYKIRASNNFSSVLEANSAIAQRMLYFNTEIRSTFFKGVIDSKVNKLSPSDIEAITISTNKLKSMTDRLISSNLTIFDNQLLDSLNKNTNNLITSCKTLFQDAVSQTNNSDNLDIIVNFQEKYQNLLNIHLKIRDILYQEKSKIDFNIINSINFARNYIIFSIFCVLGLLFPLIIYTKYSITRPLNKISSDLESLTENSDSKTILEGNNELQNISLLLNEYKEKELLIKKTLNEKDEKEKKVKKLQESIIKFHNNSNKIIEELIKEAAKLKDTASIVIEVSSNLSKDSQIVISNSNEVKNNIKSLADNSEELTSNIFRISSEIEDSIKIINNSIEQSKNASRIVNELNKSAQEIGHVTSIIRTISSQIKLLALNATIESARAGDAGHGFAIVAGEVKKLSQQTAKEIEGITNQVINVQNNAKHVEVSIKQISESITKIEQIENTVTKSISQQSTNTKQISDSAAFSQENTLEVLNIIDNFIKNAIQVKEISAILYKAVSVVEEQSSKINNEITNFINEIESKD